MGRIWRTAGIGLALMAAAACTERNDENVSLAGNTYDRFNRLDIVPPNSDLINISYQYRQHAEGESLSAEGLPSRMWLFVDRSTNVPERGLFLHLHEPDAAVPEDIEALVIMGNKRFRSGEYCLRPDSEELPGDMQPYVDLLRAQGVPFSDSLFFHRFIGPPSDHDGRRTDIIYYEDSLRIGFTCEEIKEGNNEEAIRARDRMRGNSQRSFEIMG